MKKNKGISIAIYSAIIVVVNILLCVWLMKIFSFIGWFGIEYGWLKNPRCWGCIIGIVILFVIIFLMQKVYDIEQHKNDFRISKEPTKIGMFFKVCSIILNVIAGIVAIVQLCRIWYWYGLSPAIVLAAVPALKILLVSGFFELAAYHGGK